MTTLATHRHAKSSQDFSTSNPNCIARACQIILQRTGIVIHNHRLDNLNQTLQIAQQRFAKPSCAAFLDILATCPADAPELTFLINQITVGESYFFRDEKQMAFLREQWLPATLAAKRKSGIRTLRLWSAGCSGGQELATLAILLRQGIPDLAQWNIHLQGTDIDTDALLQAMRGDYAQWSFRVTPTNIRDRFFEKHGNLWRIHDNLREMMNFSYLNLVDDSFPSVLNQTHAMDLILCRNVFIYFDRTTISQVLKKMVACLAKGGYLILGASDTILNQIPECTSITHDNQVYYRRQDPLFYPSPILTQNPSQNITPLQPFAEPTAASTGSTTQSPFANAAAANKPLPKPVVTEQQIIDLISTESWTEAIKLLEQLPDNCGKKSRLLQYKAQVLANLGYTEQTIDLCRQSIAIEATDKHVYLIQGLAFMELGKKKDAEASFRKALFLDRKFMECHFQLGLLLLAAGQTSAGNKNLKNALALTETSPSTWRVHHTSTTTFDHFAEILRAEISLYERNS